MDEVRVKGRWKSRGRELKKEIGKLGGERETGGEVKTSDKCQWLSVRLCAVFTLLLFISFRRAWSGEGHGWLCLSSSHSLFI